MARERGERTGSAWVLKVAELSRACKFLATDIVVIIGRSRLDTAFVTPVPRRGRAAAQQRRNVLNGRNGPLRTARRVDPIGGHVRQAVTTGMPRSWCPGPSVKAREIAEEKEAVEQYGWPTRAPRRTTSLAPR